MYYVFLILAAVVTVVWWASMWAPIDKPKPPVDPPVDDDSVWPPRPRPGS